MTSEQLNQAGIELDQIPQDQQLQVLEYLIGRKGLSVGATTLLEGVIAMRDQQATKPSATAGAAPGGVPAPGRLGGAQARRWYIHRAITGRSGPLSAAR